MGTLNMMVLTLTGIHVELDVNSTDTVLNIKNLLQSKLGVPPNLYDLCLPNRRWSDKFHVTFRGHGRALADDCTFLTRGSRPELELELRMEPKDAPPEIEGIDWGTRVYDYNEETKYYKVPASVVRVIVHSSVREIYVRAFKNHQNITEVEIEEGIAAIRDSAFSRCKSLQRVSIPSTVKTIGARAFYLCEVLKEVIITEGLEHIGVAAFQCCRALKCVRIPSTVKSISGQAFQRCSHLAEVKIETGVEAIEEDAFRSCRSLNRIDIPATVEGIGKESFYGCVNLKEVNIEEGVKCIGRGTFESCSSLKCVHIPSTIDNIGMTAFKYCWKLNFIRIPSTVNEIQADTFWDCRNLTKVELSEGIGRIGPGAFGHCKSLKHIKLPSSVRVIEDVVFFLCTQLSEVEMCEGLQQIGRRAFESCSSLKKIKVPSTVLTVDDKAFIDCDQLAEVELCEGLQQIGRHAFGSCSSLEKIKVPSTVLTVNDNAFESCERLAEVELCEGLQQIGTHAFGSCSSLEKIKVPSTVLTVNDNAFESCEQLAEVVLCEGLQQIGPSAFCSCSSLKKIKVPSTIVTVNEEAFAGCEQLAEVELCEGLESIGGSAFESCHSIKSIKVPSTVGVIQRYAFHGCSNLLTVELPESLEIIPREAFSSCYVLRNVVIPPNHRCQSDDAFELCFDLQRALYGTSIISALKHRPLPQMINHISSIMEKHKDAKEPEEESSSNFDFDIENFLASLQKCDCLQMTPLHILACSKSQNIQLYRMFLRTFPDNLTMKDKWGNIPLIYAIWNNASWELVQLLVESQLSHSPKFDWGFVKMVETLSRAYVPIESICLLLQMHQSHFPQQEVDWERVAHLLAIHSMVGIACVIDRRSFNTNLWFRHHTSCWSKMVQSLRTAQAPQELLRQLHSIKMKFFPNENLNWQTAFEHFVHPLDSWWDSEHVKDSVLIFEFFVRCSIPERLGSIGWREWRDEVSEIIKDNPSDLGGIHSKLLSYEHLMEATSLLELALWKAKMEGSESVANGKDHLPRKKLIDEINFRERCRVQSGDISIIRNVAAFLVC